MKLDDLIEIFQALRFPRLGAPAHPERDQVLGARAAVATAVVDDEFLVNCISWELRRLFKEDLLEGGLVPFFVVPGLGVRFAFGYWPPGGTPGPHEHTAWTITGVCRNELEVQTFDRDESYRRRELVHKNLFQAPAGRVGFIYEPCIHEPRNTSKDWSLSLHVTSPRDGERLFDYEECLPALTVPGLASAQRDHPYISVMAARQRQRFVHQLARILVSTDVAEAPHVLTECFRHASAATRSLIERKAPRFDRRDASESPWLLSRTHKQLVLNHRSERDVVALDAETPNGPVEELVISNEAREAMAFVAREPIFEVRALPGNLSEEEQTAIAEALEESGLFTRVQS